MVAYKASDVKLNWNKNHQNGEIGAPITCGYIKEGLGKNIIRFIFNLN